MSQWDRVGPGGHINRPTGPSLTRLGGQRPGFGPVFSRPNQGPGSGSPSTPPIPATPSFNALHRASASQLEGRIVSYNIQISYVILFKRFT